MEHNPELEKAEAELQESFRREKEANDRQLYARYKDFAILFAAGVHFLAFLFWTLFFVVGPFMVFLAGPSLLKGPIQSSKLFILWLLSLPSALTSLGIAIALERVLDLTSPLKLKPPEHPDPEPVELGH